MQPIQQEGMNLFISKVFRRVSLGIFISAISAIVFVFSGLMSALFSLSFGTYVYYGLLLAELGLVFWLSARVMKMSEGQAKLMFIIYSILSGVTLSVILITYESLSVFSIFIATTIMFYFLSRYGLNTSKDLTNWGRIAIFGLIGVIIAAIVNIFLGNTMLDMVLAAAGILIFVVLIAYDAQKLKSMYVEGVAPLENSADRNAQEGKMVVIGALSFYLDFINLFLSLLRLFGSRR